MPKVSIIIPTFNSEKYLKECLDSAINQTLKDIEIIVVDSASKDKTISIVEKYMLQDNRIKLIKRKKEYAGPSRNAAIKVANGDFLMFMDSDDWLELNACETAYDKILKDNSDFVLYGYKQNSEEVLWVYKDICKEIKNNVVDPKGYAHLLSRISVAPWKKIYNRKYIISNNINFSEDSFGEDLLFAWQVLLNAEKFSVLDKFLYNYRITNNSVGTGSISKRYKSNFKAFYDIEKIVLSSKSYQVYLEPFIISWINNIFYWVDKISIEQQLSYLNMLKHTLKYLDNKYCLQKICDKTLHNKVQKTITNTATVYNGKLFSIVSLPCCKHKIIKFCGIKIKIRNKKGI